jgi:hypothetical protein
MSGRRALAICAVLAFLVAFVFWRTLREAAHDLASSSSLERPAVAASGIPPTTPDGTTNAEPEGTPPAPPAREMIERDPEAAARLWTAHAKNVTQAKNRKEYGDEVARLIELPFREGWGPVMQKANDGDLRAAAAAASISSLCTAEVTRGNVPHGREHAASSFYKNLPDAMKPFIDRIAELHTKEYEQRVADCAAVDKSTDTAFTVIDMLLRPENVEAQIEIAAENKDRAAAIADLRAIVAKEDNARGRFALGDVLMGSDDPAEHAEGRALLETLASDDPAIANRLAYCLRGDAEGCGNWVPEPAAARSWFEVSAGLGDLGGLSEIGAALEADGDRAGAWAWSLYQLDLALDGCFELFYPSHIYVAEALGTEAERRARLSPAEQNAGLAISYAIEGRWAKQARERLSCE